LKKERARKETALRDASVHGFERDRGEPGKYPHLLERKPRLLDNHQPHAVTIGQRGNVGAACEFRLKPARYSDAKPATIPG
jgi:hypothetical protein